MKCQACDEPATHHVTELVAGKPEEYHVCEGHLRDLKVLRPEGESKPRLTGFAAFWEDPEFRKALKNPVAGEKMSAYLLPVLCLALLDANPEVRIGSIFHLMGLGQYAKSAIQALRNALLDEDHRVQRAAMIAIEWIEAEVPWWGCNMRAIVRIRSAFE